MDQRKPDGQSLGSDELIEDVFGLNVRGLRTVRDMFARPSLVYDAARTADWKEKYTPSVRLVFSIVTLLGFLSFFWAGEDTAFFQGFTQGFSKSASGDQFGRDDAEVAREIVGVYSATMPFVYLIGHGLISQLIRVWGSGTDRVMRLRLHMASIVPSMTFTFFVTVLMPFAEEQMTLFGITVFLGTLAMDFATSLRGGVVADTRRGRIIKAGVFALSAALGSALASILSFVCVIVSLLTFIS